MRRVRKMSATRKTAVFLVICALMVAVSRVNADGLFGGKTLGQRLDDLGRTLFGSGPADDKDSPSARSEGSTTAKKTAADGASADSPAPRAGSISDNAKAPQDNRELPPPPATPSSNRPQRPDSAPQPAASNPVSQPPAGLRPNRPPLGTSFSENENFAGDAPVNRSPMVGGSASQSNVAPGVAATPGGQPPQPARAGDFGPSPSQPIQNRLMQSRISAFQTPAEQQPAAANNATSNTNPPSPRRDGYQPAFAGQPTPAATAHPTPAGDENVPARPVHPTPAKRPPPADLASPPLVAQRTQPIARSGSERVNDRLPQGEPDVPSRVAAPAPPAKDDGLLFTRRGPVLSVETLGPRKIIVGKESTYEVVLSNTGEVAAEEVTVFVNLPEWAEITHAEASSGTPRSPALGQAAAFQWKLARLEAKAKEKLSLRIIPRQSKPFDLAVRWDYKPVASQAMIEVQEPKLEMQLDGPRDVFFGKKETYRLKMMNTGTGAAEGVVVKLMPIGAGENVPATYQLGVLPAGETKNIDIELTARQAGELSIQVEAKGDAGIHAELAEKVQVRRAGLDVTVEGPKLQYVGATGVYVIRVRNSGNAPATNIHFTATVPPGVKYTGGIEGAAPTPRATSCNGSWRRSIRNWNRFIR